MATNDDRADRGFYASLPVFAGFPQIMDPARYAPLTDGWWPRYGMTTRRSAD